MSQPDFIAELRGARPVAPAEVRERVRLIALEAQPATRRLTWRRSLLVAVPVAAALVAAALLVPGHGARNATRTTESHAPLDTESTLATPPVARKAAGPLSAAGTAAATPSFAPTGTVPAPSANRIQRYSASLELRVANPFTVSEDTKKAVRITKSLGGFASSVQVDAAGRNGSATLVLRVPKEHVQQAVTRLSALGTIVGENVSIKDLTPQVDATTRKLARLKADLARWQALPQTTATEAHVTALGAQIARLQRGRAGTVRAASLATVRLALTTAAAPVPVATHHHHGPLHNLGVTLRWAGIGAIYVLALGSPLAALCALAWLGARLVRRRRDDQLLSRS